MLILNRIKEHEVKQKIQNGKTLRVMFLVDDLAKFKANSVYIQMKNSIIFEPFVVVFKLYNVKDTDGCKLIEKKHKENINYFKENGYVVFDAHDEDGDAKDLEDFSPDIIFTSCIPYLNSPMSPYSGTYLCSKWLVCYLTYGINSSANYNYHFNNPIIALCWKHFEIMKNHFSESLSFSKYSGINTKYFGNPFFDDYTTENKEEIAPFYKEKRPIVIYAPHWTIDIENYEFNSSTLVSLGDKIYNLAKANSKVFFVLKPHPSLKYISYLRKNNNYSIQNYYEFTEKWNSLNNCGIYEGYEYIKIFKRASLLITDCYSFIGEWLPSMNPCIILSKCQNEKQLKILFNPIGNKIIETYYVAYNFQQLKKLFTKLLEGEDCKKNARKLICKEIFNKIGGAGARITNYIGNTLR